MSSGLVKKFLLDWGIYPFLISSLSCSGTQTEHSHLRNPKERIQRRKEHPKWHVWRIAVRTFVMNKADVGRTKLSADGALGRRTLLSSGLKYQAWVSQQTSSCGSGLHSSLPPRTHLGLWHTNKLVLYRELRKHSRADPLLQVLLLYRVSSPLHYSVLKRSCSPKASLTPNTKCFVLSSWGTFSAL